MENRSDRLAGHPVYFQTLSQFVSSTKYYNKFCALYTLFIVSRVTLRFYIFELLEWIHQNPQSITISVRVFSRACVNKFIVRTFIGGSF